MIIVVIILRQEICFEENFDSNTSLESGSCCELLLSLIA
jgi:hypothetical protein